MRCVQIALILAMIFLASGCGWSPWPSYTGADLIFDKRLLGTWSSDNDDDAQTFILTKGSDSEAEKGSAVSR